MNLRWLAAALALLAPAPALAWWEYGHHTVAEIAERTVRPATRAQVARLIRRSALLETPDCPVRTLADAAYWPDCVRAYKDRFSYSFPWHYQNVDICKPFDQASACRDGNCVSAQIERNTRLLADAKLPDRERLQALAFLTHFVGDLHMPLHAGDRGDKGGNDFAASYGLIAGRANLHSIWDGYLAERGISTPQGGTAGLLAEFGAQRSALMTGSVTDWARESWAASRTFAYGSVMADPCGRKPATRPVIDETKTRVLIPVVRLQIARGGMRLGRLLDEALG
jgi:hypothetical protein